MSDIVVHELAPLHHIVGFQLAGSRFTPYRVSQVVAGPVVAPVTQAGGAGLGLLAHFADLGLF